MNDAFIGLIIGVYKPGPEAFWHPLDGKAMILRGQIAFLGANENRAVILPAMTKSELVSIPARGQSQNLVAKTNTQNRNTFFHGCSCQRNSVCGHLGIARAVGKQNPVKAQLL